MCLFGSLSCPNARMMSLRSAIICSVASVSRFGWIHSFRIPIALSVGSSRILWAVQRTDPPGAILPLNLRWKLWQVSLSLGSSSFSNLTSFFFLSSVLCGFLLSSVVFVVEIVLFEGGVTRGRRVDERVDIGVGMGMGLQPLHCSTL